jgi:hypothetical protein
MATVGFLVPVLSDATNDMGDDLNLIAFTAWLCRYCLPVGCSERTRPGWLMSSE